MSDAGATPFVRRPDFWPMAARAAALGVLGATTTVAFLGAEHWLHHLLWGGHEPTAGWFTGPPRAVAVLLVAGVVVGLARRRSGLTPPDPNFVDEIVHGRTDPREAISLVGIGLVSLVAGASLGPEAPIGTAGAGLGTAVAERSVRRRATGSPAAAVGRSPDGTRADPEDTATDDEAEVADAAFAGLSGVFGALLTFPFAVPLLALEMQHPTRFDGYRRLLPGVISATVALGVLYPFIGAPFLGLFAVPAAALAPWHLAAGVLLGLVGAVLGVVTAVVTGLAGTLLGRVEDVLVRAVLGAGVLGLLLVAVPLTGFSGREELPIILEQGASLGLGVLVASLVGKMITFAVSMRAGFFGGAILPLVFIGGTGGVLLHEAWPALPLLHAVAGVSAATATALVPLPLSLMVVTLLMFATGVEAGAVPAVAAVTSFVAVHGTAVLPALGRLLAPGRRRDGTGG